MESDNGKKIYSGSPDKIAGEFWGNHAGGGLPKLRKGDNIRRELGDIANKILFDETKDSKRTLKQLGNGKTGEGFKIFMRMYNEVESDKIEKAVKENLKLTDDEKKEVSDFLFWYNYSRVNES